MITLQNLVESATKAYRAMQAKRTDISIPEVSLPIIGTVISARESIRTIRDPELTNLLTKTEQKTESATPAPSLPATEEEIGKNIVGLDNTLSSNEPEHKLTKLVSALSRCVKAQLATTSEAQHEQLEALALSAENCKNIFDNSKEINEFLSQAKQFCREQIKAFYYRSSEQDMQNLERSIEELKNAREQDVVNHEALEKKYQAEIEALKAEKHKYSSSNANLRTQLQSEMNTHKTIVDELTAANDALKKQISERSSSAGENWATTFKKLTQKPQPPASQKNHNHSPTTHRSAPGTKS